MKTKGEQHLKYLGYENIALDGNWGKAYSKDGKTIKIDHMPETITFGEQVYNMQEMVAILQLLIDNGYIRKDEVENNLSKLMWFPYNKELDK